LKLKPRIEGVFHVRKRNDRVDLTDMLVVKFYSCHIVKRLMLGFPPLLALGIMHV
jgi:hypothetical protein